MKDEHDVVGVKGHGEPHRCPPGTPAKDRHSFTPGLPTFNHTHDESLQMSFLFWKLQPYIMLMHPQSRTSPPSPSWCIYRFILYQDKLDTICVCGRAEQRGWRGASYTSRSFSVFSPSQPTESHAPVQFRN